MKNDEIRRLIDANDKFQRHFAAYKDQSKKILAEKILELERCKQAENFHDLMTKKTQYGYLRSIPPVRSIDDWVDGILITRLKEERQNIEAQMDTLELEKRTTKNKKRKTNEFTQDHKENIKTLMSNLAKRMEDIDNQMSSFNSEKYDIFYRDKLINEANNCFFMKKNTESQLQAWPLLKSRYQVVSLIGHGGFSEVYKAFDLDCFRYVVLKLHSSSPKWDLSVRDSYLKHATRENEVYKQLDHPNIVQYYDSIEVDNMSFSTILEYCEGADLDYQLKRFGAMSEKVSKNIIKQILMAIKYLNDQTPKIIHYDLKPQNILFTKEGIVKLTDFGLCKVFDTDDSKIELTSQGAGTYWYLAPECFETGKNPPLISSKVDIWAIGVILYQMLYGKKPFGQNMSQEKIQKEKIILRSTSVSFPDKPHISNELKDFIRKCLIYDQNLRIDIYGACTLFSKLN